MVFSNQFAGQDKNTVALLSVLLTVWYSICRSPSFHRVLSPIRPYYLFQQLSEEGIVNFTLQDEKIKVLKGLATCLFPVRELVRLLTYLVLVCDLNIPVLNLKSYPLGGLSSKAYLLFSSTTHFLISL